MPLIQTTTTPQTPEERRAKELESKVKSLLSSPTQSFQTLLRSWGDGMVAIWKDPKPEEVLKALGTDATELFQLSGKTIAFLESVSPGCTDRYTSLVKPFTVHPDGTVTLN